MGTPSASCYRSHIVPSGPTFSSSSIFVFGYQLISPPVFRIPPLSAETLTQFLIFSVPSHCSSQIIHRSYVETYALSFDLKTTFLEDHRLFKTPFVFSSQGFHYILEFLVSSLIPRPHPIWPLFLVSDSAGQAHQ